MSTESVGRCPTRPDGHAKVTGAARYVDDIDVPGAWHGSTVRSPHPSARIVSIDASRAIAADSEVVWVTASDIRGPRRLKLIEEDWPILAEEFVRHVGEAVALVAAPTRERARRAAERIDVEYEETTAVLDLDAALADTPRVDGLPLELARCGIDHGDVDAALAKADRIFESTYETGHQEHVYIEPQGIVARFCRDGYLEILGSMQCPYYIHHAIEPVFADDCRGIRVIQSVTGGGFGGKEDYPDILAAHAGLLAKACDHPVKIVYSRHEDIIATTKRHPSRVRHRTGIMNDGTVVAMDIDVLFDGGAYVTLSPVVLSRGVLHAGGAYRCENVRIKGRALATNTATNGAFRGFGAPQTAFAIERHMDLMARELGMDPYAIREKNAYREGDVTPTGQVLEESVSAIACLEEAERRTNFRARWAEFESARDEAPDDGRPRPGIGLSLFWHGTGFTGNGEREMKCRAAVELRPGGRLKVLVASTDFGQGTETVLAQMAADASGFDVARVSVAQPDTSRVPNSGPTVASRTVMVVGGVLARAAADLSRALKESVAMHTGIAAATIELAGDHFVDRKGRVVADLAAIGDLHLAENGPLRVERTFQPPADDIGFDEKTYQGAAYPAYGWGADVIELNVCPDTYETRVTKATLIADIGRAIHPVLCEGQVEGGTLQAIGWAYMEEIKMSGGHYLNDRLTNYIIPTARDVPDMETVLIENPTSANPFGAKGVGELPMDGGAPALLAAIENATGIAMSMIPATPERLLAARTGGGARS